MSEFTKGPWEARLMPQTTFITAKSSDSEPTMYICDTNKARMPMGEEIANAQLIAASPDMYNALKEEMKEWDSCNHPSFRVMELIQDALNKADDK